MTTQLKETKYYVFWTIAMIAFICPQIIAALAYHKIADYLSNPVKVEVVEPIRLKL